MTFTVSDGELKASETITITVQNVNRPPAAPSALSVTFVSSTQVTLIWTDNSNNETGFKVFRSTDGTHFTQIATSSTATYSDISLTPNTLYYYEVSAYNSGGESAFAGPVKAETLDTPPAAPSSLLATAVSSSQINLAWTDNSNNEKGFKVFRSTDGVRFNQIDTLSANVTTYSNTSRTPNTLYYYKVSAYNNGGESVAGPVSATTAPEKPPNRPPVFDPIADKTISESELLRFKIHATDLDGDPLVYSVQKLPKGAVFDLESALFSWTPDYEQAGIYPVTFTVSDGELKASETITITVQNVNRPPVLEVPGPQKVKEGEKLEFWFSGVDPDGDPLSLTDLVMPEGMVLTASLHTGPLDPDRPIYNKFSSWQIEWTPTYEQSGVYPVTFTVADGAQKQSATISVTVENVNRPPELVNPPRGLQGAEGQLLEFRLQARDPDGDPIRFVAEGLPTGAVLDEQTGAFRWTPGYDQAGEYGIGLSVTEMQFPLVETKRMYLLSIRIANVNRPPEILSLASSPTIGRSGWPVRFRASAADPDQDTLSFAWNFGDGSLRTGRSVSHAYWRAGTYRITLTVSDGKGGTATRTLEKRVRK